MLVDDSSYNSENNDYFKIPKNYIEGTQSIKDYLPELVVSYSYKKTTENLARYEVSWQVPFSTRISGTGRFVTLVPVSRTSFVRQRISIKNVPDQPVTIANPSSPFNGYPYSSKIFSRTDILSVDYETTKNTKNSFHYTNDVNRSKRWDEYAIYRRMSGSSSSSTLGAQGLSLTPLEAGVGSGIGPYGSSKVRLTAGPTTNSVSINGVLIKGNPIKRTTVSTPVVRRRTSLYWTILNRYKFFLCVESSKWQ
jgi:hypothetical protein